MQWWLVSETQTKIRKSFVGARGVDFIKPKKKVTIKNSNHFQLVQKIPKLSGKISDFKLIKTNKNTSRIIKWHENKDSLPETAKIIITHDVSSFETTVHQTLT